MAAHLVLLHHDGSSCMKKTSVTVWFVTNMSTKLIKKDRKKVLASPPWAQQTHVTVMSLAPCCICKPLLSHFTQQAKLHSYLYVTCVTWAVMWEVTPLHRQPRLFSMHIESPYIHASAFWTICEHTSQLFWYVAASLVLRGLFRHLQPCPLHSRLHFQHSLLRF